MFLRAAVVAVSVLCVPVAAMAADNYTEAWNPPEAGHAMKSVKLHHPASKTKAIQKQVHCNHKSPETASKNASPLAQNKVKTQRVALKSTPKQASRKPGTGQPTMGRSKFKKVMAKA